MDFHHDEISALLRTRFDSFDQLIDQGIRIDGHPGLVQWFLWVWTGLFGYSPWVVKLPFILTGIASVWVMFALARSMFSIRTAWVSASLMAVLQYGVTYSQWARPYACGLFFVLLAALFLLRYLKEEKNGQLVAFALAAALAGYTHYFALLQVLVVSLLITPFKADRRQWKYLIVGALIAVVLWLPHLNITLGHLSIGGIGDWLQPPAGDFWMELIAYSFHYSWLVGGLALLLILSGMLQFDLKRSIWLDRMLLLGMWLIPYLIAFWYSHAVSALMHYGSMFFTFPFLVLLVASFSEHLQNTTVKLISLSFIVLGGYTLFGPRDHVGHNLRTEYQDPLRFVEDVRSELPDEFKDIKIKVVADIRQDAAEFLERERIADFSKVQLIEPIWNEGLWSHYLDTTSTEGLVIVTTPASVPEFLTTAQWYYPSFFSGRSYHTAGANFLLRAPMNTGTVLALDTASHALTDEEFGWAISYTFAADWDDRYTFFEVMADFKGKVGSSQLVYEWKSEDGREAWRSSHLRDFRQAGPNQTVFIGGNLEELPGFESGGTLKAYVWNPEGDSIQIDHIMISGEQGRDRDYGLFGPL